MTILRKTITAATLALALGSLAGMTEAVSAMPINTLDSTSATPLAVEHVQYYGGYGYGYRRPFFRPYGPGFYGRPYYGRRFYGPGFYGRGYGYRGYGY